MFFEMKNQIFLQYLIKRKVQQNFFVVIMVRAQITASRGNQIEKEMIDSIKIEINSILTDSNVDIFQTVIQADSQDNYHGRMKGPHNLAMVKASVLQGGSELLQVVIGSSQMSNSYEKRIKPDEKMRPKRDLYYKRINCYILGESISNGERYLLELTTLADPTKSLAEAFLYFSHSIFEIGPKQPPPSNFKNLQFNKLFRFMVEMYHLHEKYLPVWFKITEQVNQSVRDIIGDRYGSDEEQGKRAMKQMIQRLYQASRKVINLEIQAFQNEQSAFTKVRIVKQRLVQRYQEEILSIKDSQLRAIYIPQKKLQPIAAEYIKRLLTTLMNIQFSRKKYRHFKMQYFLKSYKEFWQVDFVEGTRGGIRNQRKLLIKRYTSVKNLSGSCKTEVLMNLNDLVDLRRKDVTYVKEDLQVIKQLGNELRRHKKATKNCYPLLHPRFVVFNQLSLKVSLSYQAPLLAALGLLKQPASHEQAIAFVATPHLFDQFSAPGEHLRSSDEDLVGTGDQIFYDLFYGMDSLVKAYDPRSKHLDVEQVIKGKNVCMKDIKAERETSSEAWRFVMVASYLLNGREYYKSIVDPLFDYARFKRFLIQERRKCEHREHRSPKEYVKSVMGPKFTEYLTQSKIELDESEEISLTIFDTFLGVKQEVSEISVNSRFFKVEQLIERKQTLKKDLFEILLQGKDFNKMSKVMRYFTMLHLILFQLVSNIHLVLEFYAQGFAKGREFVRFKWSKIGLGGFGQSEEDKNLEKAYNSIKSTEAKYENKPSEHINHLLKNYEASYKAIDANRNAFLQLKKKMKLAIVSEQSEALKENILEMMGESAVLKRKFHNIVLEIMDREFPQSVEALAGEERRKVLFLHSIHVKVRLFLQLSHDNYLTLDSLVYPILGLEKDCQSSEVVPLYEYAREILREHEGEGQPRETGSAPPKQPT